MRTKNNFNHDQILKEQVEIDKLIEQLNDLDEERSDPTYDGITNIPFYCAAPIKIMWILKEVNDDGGYNQRESFNSEIKIDNRSGWYRTLDPIIYASYGILNNCMLMDDIPKIVNEPMLIDVLKQIAYINIKKIPGGAGSDMLEINSAFQRDKNIIMRQIAMANPDIIIGGNTLPLIYHELKIREEDIVKTASGWYYATKERLYISAYHPNQRSIKHEDYCNGIIQAAKGWLET